MTRLVLVPLGLYAALSPVFFLVVAPAVQSAYPDDISSRLLLNTVWCSMVGAVCGVIGAHLTKRRND